MPPVPHKVPGSRSLYFISLALVHRFTLSLSPSFHLSLSPSLLLALPSSLLSLCISHAFFSHLPDDNSSLLLPILPYFIVDVLYCLDNA